MYCSLPLKFKFNFLARLHYFVWFCVFLIICIFIVLMVFFKKFYWLIFVYSSNCFRTFVYYADISESVANWPFSVALINWLIDWLLLFKVKSRSELWSKRPERGVASNGGRVDLITTLCWPTSCTTLWYGDAAAGTTTTHDQTGSHWARSQHSTHLIRPHFILTELNRSDPVSRSSLKQDGVTYFALIGRSHAELRRFTEHGQQWNISKIR